MYENVNSQRQSLPQIVYLFNELVFHETQKVNEHRNLSIKQLQHSFLFSVFFFLF